MQLTKPIFPNSAIFIKEKWVNNWCWGKSEILWRNFFNSWQVGNQSLHQTGFAWRPASKKYAKLEICKGICKMCKTNYKKYARNMQEICKKYARNMLNMQKICTILANNMPKK